jgi:hypothetical protein
MVLPVLMAQMVFLPWPIFDDVTGVCVAGFLCDFFSNSTGFISQALAP